MRTICIVALLGLVSTAVEAQQARAPTGYEIKGCAWYRLSPGENKRPTKWCNARSTERQGSQPVIFDTISKEVSAGGQQ